MNKALNGNELMHMLQSVKPTKLCEHNMCIF